MKYGDILKYRNEPGAEIYRFMFIFASVQYIRVLVVRIDTEDDLWRPRSVDPDCRGQRDGTSR